MTPAKTLTDAERQAYESNKAIVREGEAQFVRVGLALMEICDSRLYREQYGSFAEFCAAEYNFSDRRGRQLIAAARIVKDMQESGTSCSDLPKNESQAREAIKEKRKPIVDAVINPAPVVDVDPTGTQQDPPSLDTKWKDATGMVGVPEPELPPHIAALIDELKLCRDNCDCFIGCIKSHECDADSLKDAATHLKQLATMLRAYAMEISQ